MLGKKKKDKKGKNKDEETAAEDGAPEAEETTKPEGEAAEGEGGAEELDLDGKKKKIKPLFLIIGAVVLLAGAGAGVYFSGLLDGVLGKGGGESGEHAEAGGDHGGGGGGHGKEGGGTGANFMELPDLVVNLSTNQGQQRYLKLKVQLELENATDKAAVEAIAPRVIDHFQTYLRELRISDLRGSAGIYRLRQELVARVNAAAAPVKVKDVLFQEILIQ